MNNIKSKVAMIAIEVLENQVDLATIIEISSLEELGMNSLMYMNLIIKLEMYFEIEFDDEMLSIENFDSVDKIAEHILKSRKTI